MSTTVFLAICLDDKVNNRVRVDLDLDSKVCMLREQVSKTVNHPTEDFDLLYAGVQLQDKETLASYHFKSGYTIHVLPRFKPQAIKVNKEMTTEEITKYLNMLEAYGHKNILQKYPPKDLRDKLLKLVPDLILDVSALAFILNAELVVMFAQPALLHKILTKHPILADVLPHIMTHLRENPITPISNQASTSAANSYSLDALSDDEDMENISQDSREGGVPLSRTSSGLAITAAQLSEALASARNHVTTPTVVDDMLPPSAGPIITNEMFGSALQQAFASATAAQSSASDAAVPPSNPELLAALTIPPEESLESLRTRLQPQLQQMKEMGLLDETKNIRALQLTAGDVQAAIEMVFGGDIDMNF